MPVPLTLSSVPDLLPNIQYVSAGGQTVFPYPFPITLDADLIVVINGVTQPTGLGYTLSGQGNPTGGNLTFPVGQLAGTIITLFRDVEIQRITQIQQNSGFSSTAFNAEFNQIYLIMQQLDEAISFSLQIPNTNNPAPVTTLLPSAYANSFLGFDANGNPQPVALTSSAITATIIAALLNGGAATVNSTVINIAQTPAEVTAAAVPTNPSFVPGDIRRYGATTASVDNTVAIQAAINA